MPVGKKIKILVVEDELSYRALLQRTIIKAGYQCYGCIDGEYALEKLKKEKYDVLILDYILPGHNAVEILQWAREQKIDTPAIVITGYPSESLHEQCSQLKNVHLLIKAHTDADEIIKKVETILKKH